MILYGVPFIDLKDWRENTIYKQPYNENHQIIRGFGYICPITLQHPSLSITKDKHYNECCEHLQIGCSLKILDNVNNNTSININRNIH